MAHPLAGKPQSPEHVAKRTATMRATWKTRRQVQYVEADRGFSSPCWVWQLSLNDRGYAYYSSRRDGVPFTKRAHRMIYEEQVGLIPAGLDLDHLCGQRDCVNPAHMEPVTRSENCLRREARKRLRRA